MSEAVSLTTAAKVTFASSKIGTSEPNPVMVGGTFRMETEAVRTTDCAPLSS